MYTNIDGVIGKTEELKELVDKKDPDIIAITETKLKEVVRIITAIPQGYHMLRKEREGGGGGIAIGVKEYLEWETIHITLASQFQEYLVAGVKVGKEEIIIAVIYNPPRNNDKPHDYEVSNEGTIEVISKVARMAVERKNRLVIMGDFNHKDIDWEKMDPHGESHT